MRIRPITARQSQFWNTAKLAAWLLVIVGVTIGQCSERFDRVRVGSSWPYAPHSEGEPREFGSCCALSTFSTQVNLLEQMVMRVASL